MWLESEFKFRVGLQTGNSYLASFWFDSWSPLGRLHDIAGDRGVTDMGINRRMTVAYAWRSRHRRRHRNNALNSIEDVLHSQWLNRKDQKTKLCEKEKKNTNIKN